MNKKGAEKVLSVYWFVILFLVAGGVFAMTVIFYGSPYDVREVEAGILTDKVADCISYGGKMNPVLLNSSGVFNTDFDKIFLKECHLNFGNGQDSEYYVKVNFFRFADLNNPAFVLSYGNSNLFSGCEIKSEDYNKISRCVSRRFYAVDGNNEQYLIEIFSVVRKTNENVK
jgi:hypothetical protein